MATKVDELIVEIRAETRDLNKKLKEMRGELDRSSKGGLALGASLRMLGPLLASAAVISGIKAIASIGDEFERLRISLATLYGGPQGAEKAFSQINKFAQTTPFQLEDVTNAFIQLKANGIEPTANMLTIFGDAASATLRPLESFQALVRITQRAAQGGLGLEELEQLSDRGIPVYKILNDQLGITRLEISEIGKTAEGAATIMTALNKGLQENFGGLMASQMDLLSTKTSNLAIAFKQVGDELYQSGLDRILKDAADSATAMVNAVYEFLNQQRTGKPIPAFISDLIDEGEFDRARIALNRQMDELTQIIDSKFAKVVEMKAAGRLRGLTTGPIEDEISALQLELKNLLDAFNSLPEKAPVPIVTKQLTTEELEAIEAMKKVLEETITPAEELGKAFEALALAAATGMLPEEELERIRAHLEGLRNEMALEIINDQVEIAAESFEYLEDAARDALNVMQSEYGDLASVVKGTVTPIETLRDEISQLEAVLASGDADVIKFIFGDRGPAEIREALDRLGVELKELEDDLVSVSKTFEEVMAPAIAAAAQAFTSDFVNSLMEGEDALDSFKNFAKDIVGQIITTFLQMEVINKILNGVFGGVKGYTPLPTSNIFGKAGGGGVNGGTPYLVGERGPEMFVPNSGGRIVNGHNTRNMMEGGGGVVVNQTINLSAGVAGTVRAEVQRMMPEIANVTKAGVLEATRRGGTYRRGLLGS